MTSLPVALLAAAALAAEPWTEARAVQVALDQSATLAAMRAQVQEQRANVELATPVENPDLRISNFRSDRLLSPAFSQAGYVDPPFEDVTFALRWKPPNLTAWSAQRAEAERRVEYAEAELLDARAELAARVRTLHATALGLAAQRALAQGALTRRDELRTLVRRRLEQHAANVLDQSLTDLDYLEALASLQDLESKERLAVHELRLLLGLAPEAPLELESALPACAAPTRGPEALVAQAQARSAKLRGFGARLAELEAERRGLDLSLLPWPNFLQLGYTLGAGGEDQGHFSLRVGVPLPLFDWKRAEVRAVDAQRARVEAEQRAKQEQLASQVRRAAEELAAQAALVQRYREAEPVLDDGLVRLKRSLEVSEVDLLQIALVQTRVLAARRAGLKAALECRYTQIELDRLTGCAEAWR